VANFYRVACYALWVQIRTFFKNEKLTTHAKEWPHSLAAEKNILKVMRLICLFYHFANFLLNVSNIDLKVLEIYFLSAEV
jgi:hypothetical protein